MHDEVGVADGLPEADEQVEDVRVVVEQGARGDIGTEASLGCEGGGEGRREQGEGEREGQRRAGEKRREAVESERRDCGCG